MTHLVRRSTPAFSFILSSLEQQIPFEREKVEEHDTNLKWAFASLSLDYLSLSGKNKEEKTFLSKTRFESTKSEGSPSSFLMSCNYRVIIPPHYDNSICKHNDKPFIIAAVLQE